MSEAPDARRARLPGLLLVAFFGLVAAIALAALGATAFREAAPFFVLVGLAWGALVAGRVLWWLDRPAGLGGMPGELGLGLALGLAGTALLQGLVEGATPWWALAAGAGWGAYRAHAPLLRAQRAKDAPPARRLGGVLDPREVGALALLVGGYALVGVALHRLFLAFALFIPDAGKAATLGAAVYALNGARLLLRFAAHEGAPAPGGPVGWLKANLLKGAIALLLLAAYWIYREDLARSVPYFPLAEFLLGMGVFGALLARLRWRLRRDRAEHATASDARPHVPRVEPITEGEYEAVARPLARFLESGRGASDYEAVVRETARLDGADAQAVLDPVRRWRAPVEDPPLPLAWSVGALVAASLGVAIAAAALALGLGTMDAGPPSPDLVALALMLALVTTGLGAYVGQDHARAHRRPWPGAALAIGGTLLVALGGALFLSRLQVPPVAWGVFALVALLMGGIPVLKAWRLERRLARGEQPPLAAELPSALLEKGLAGARRTGATAALGAVVLLVLVPFVLGWLTRVAPVPEGVVATYGVVSGAATWILAGVGASALLRFWGLSRARPSVVAAERRRREERLLVHAEIMRRLERV